MPAKHQANFIYQALKGSTEFSLTEFQVAAIESQPQNPALIIAGAGTGKTTTLAHRVAHLVLQGVDPARILLLTFSRRAAQEMRRRAHDIVRRALTVPLRQIAENAGVEGSIVVGKILENKSETFGFDAQSEDYVDMLAKGIVDPAKVVRTALQDAASVAGLLVTTTLAGWVISTSSAAVDHDPGVAAREVAHGECEEDERGSCDARHTDCLQVRDPRETVVRVAEIGNRRWDVEEDQRGRVDARRSHDARVAMAA